MIGKTLAHYEILEKLGSGGMGDVYRARDSKLGREVAIKVLPDEFSRDPERRKRFSREAQAIASLKHPHIVTIYSVEEAEDVSFITMELVEGDTLSRAIPKNGLPLDRFFSYSIDLADAVSSAHDEGITHRDLKPANVMFDKGGRLKVLDFGLAKLLDRTVDAERAKTVVQGSDTAVGQILGTAAYMSPEQAEGKPIDHRSDIFSLGIVLYEMATGERPFKGDTHISTISSIIKDTPPHVSELNHTLPRHLGRIVSHCLEKNPDRRYQSAKDVRNELEGLKKEVDSGELSQTMTSGTSFAVPAHKSRTWLPWAILGVVVVGLAGVFWMLRPSGPSGVTETTEVSANAGSGVTSRVASAVPAAPDTRKMTVVFPFENLGPPEDAYFAAGMSEEITSRLAAVSGLGVISRTSATQYDRTGKTIREIGEDLGVDYVLEGSVRWAKQADGTGRVRITPQLIRVADDTHIWSETYDREVDDIFEIQTDIANRVIDQLDVTLLGSERDLVENAPTKNMEAYKLYLQAKDLKLPDWDEYDARYVELLEKATELDPSFVTAWGELSQHHSSRYAGLDRTDERLSRARRALQRAEEIDPTHYRTRIARGYYYYYGFRDYDRAITDFLAATEIMPNDADAREAVGYIYRRQGKWAEHLENLKAALELDPQDADIAGNLAATFRGLREFEEAVRYLDKAAEIDPNDASPVMEKAFAFVAWKGDLRTAREILKDVPKENPFFHQLGWWFLHMQSREFSSAADNAREMDESSPLVKALKWHLVSIAEAASTSPDEARSPLERANREIEALLESSPGNADGRMWLSENLALLGRGQAAVREAKLAVDLRANDKFAGPGALENLARVYTMVGRHDEAIDLLERLLETVYEGAITRQMLKNDPVWDPLREHPRFQELLPEQS